MAKAKIKDDSLEIKDGSFEVKNKNGEGVITANEKGDITIGTASFSEAEHIGQITGDVVIDLDKLKFVMNEKEYTSDDILNILADKIVQRLRGGIKFATPSK